VTVTVTYTAKQYQEQLDAIERLYVENARLRNRLAQANDAGQDEHENNENLTHENERLRASLDAIHATLDQPHDWNSDTVEGIAAVLKAAGYVMTHHD
jgi:hypothetical protein